MKRWLIGVALALAASVASAGPCFPSGELTPINLQGKNLLEGYSPVHKGTWRAIWCPTGTFSPTTGGERWVLYTHAVLDKYATLSTSTLLGIVKSALESDDPLGLLTSVVKSGEYIPPAGTQDRFDWESTLYIACTEGRKFPPFTPAVFNGPCAAPTPLPVTETWRTPPTGTYTVYTSVNGKLSGIVSGVKATANAECLCTLNSILSGTSRYCPTDPARPERVTYCVRPK